MNTRTKIFSILYLVVTSVTVLVMLVDSFEQLNEKYLPSFMLAQKFALPIILSSLAFVFLVYFEPERLERKSNLLVMRILLLVTVVLFSYFVSTVNMKLTSEPVMIVYAIQLLSTIATAVFFFARPSKN